MTPSTLASTMAPLRRLAFLALSAAAFASLASPVLGDDSSHAHTPKSGKVILQPTDPGADPAATDAAAKAEDLKPLAETLASEALEFDTLIAAVNAVVAADAAAVDLNQPGPFTVFAPTDAAFQAFLAESGKTPEQILADPDLPEILQHHVVRGKFTAADVLAMDLPALVPTLDEKNAVKIDKTVDGDVLVGGAKVSLPDIEATNGVAHGIDAVILEVEPVDDA